MTALNPEVSPDLIQQATGLMLKMGQSGAFTLVPLVGGRNNRVFRLETDAGFYLFKKYFQSPQDTRDRLRHEVLLLEYLQANGSHYAARPYAWDGEKQAAIMEYIVGERITASEVGERHIDAAIGFFTELNRNRSSELGRALPLASEACFSLQEHVARTQGRMERLQKISRATELDRSAQALAHDQVIPLWSQVKARIENTEDKARLLSEQERSLSPSDFGFHNALAQKDGQFRFVDFEYAGWDDPAKLVIDFANQPDMILPESFSGRFTKAVVESQLAPEKLIERIKLLEPLYQLKWVCICLNDFLEIGQSRRRFTGEESLEQETARKTLQLDRARMMLNRARSKFLI